MIVKSIIAGTVLSLMAGGVVYFGTDVDAAAVKDKVVQKTTDMKAEISDRVMAGGEKEHPHSKKTEARDSKRSADISSVTTPSGKVIKAKKPIVSSSETKKKKIKTAEVTSPEAPQKKWLNQYLKTDTPKTETKTKTITKTVTTEEVVTEDNEGAEDNNSVAKDLMASMGLTEENSENGGSKSDTGTFIIEGDGEDLTEADIEAAVKKGFKDRALKTGNIWIEDGTDRKTAERKMLSDIIKKDRAIFIGDGADGEKKVEIKVIANEDGETTTETETIDMGDGKVMKIVKKTVKTEEGHGKDGHKKMRIKVISSDGSLEEVLGDMDIEDINVIKMGDISTAGKLEIKTKAKDISGTVKVVMEQAEKIKMPELRDRAYLDLVSYGLDHSNYKVAGKALKKIEQVELRDTARNRIAIAHAKDGNAQEAFGILENIEVDALRDVMRLQVIEAMIAPDQLPEDMQQ